MRFEGTAIKYGDNINTDVIIPARYLNTTKPEELAKYCMEDLDQTFVKRVKTGDIMVAGRNFGCGSSREHAPIAIKASGISCIIAETFARIFFRNAINIGLPIMESPEASQRIQEADQLELDLIKGTIRNATRNETYAAQPFPEFMRRIVDAGGLMAYVKQRLNIRQPARPHER